MHGIGGTVPAVIEGSNQRHEQFVFWVLLSLLVWQVWSTPHLPTQDGPAHMASAQALLLYNSADHPWISRSFRVNTLPTPSWGAQLILVGFLKLFPAAVAEKLLASLYVLFFGFAVRYLLSAISKEAGSLSVLFLPFALNFLFHMGFYSFCLSLPLFLFVHGWWWRRRELRWFQVPTLMLWALLLWLAHPVTVVAAGLSLTSLVIFNAWIDGVGTPWEKISRIRRRLLPVLVSFSPAAVLVVVLRVLQGSVDSHWMPLLVRAQVLLLADVLSSFATREMFIGLAAAVAIVGLGVAALWRRRTRLEFRSEDGFAVSAAFCVVLFFLAPNRFTTEGGWSGGGLVSHRLSLFVFLLVLAWIASQSWGRAARHVMILGSALLVLGLMSSHRSVYPLAEQGFEDLAAADEVLRREEPFIFIGLSPYGPPGVRVSQKVRLFLHGGQRLAWGGDRVEWTNYQQRSGWIFPLRIREEVVASDLPHLPGRWGLLDLNEFDRLSPEPVGQILFWGLPPEPTPRLAPLFEQLQSRWVLKWVSPRGWTRVYVRKS